jgi:hypothetical protein
MNRSQSLERRVATGYSERGEPPRASHTAPFFFSLSASPRLHAGAERLERRDGKGREVWTVIGTAAEELTSVAYC